MDSWKARVVAGALLLCAGLLCCPAASGDASSPHSQKPTVLLFLVASAPADIQREKQFVEELGLALDGFSIRPMPMTEPSFSSVPLSTQLQIMAQHTRDHNAVASVWLEHPSLDSVFLHLVALSTGRALVRIIEADDTPSAASELAFSAQELLAQAYMFDDVARPSAVDDVVDGVTEKLRPKPEEHHRVGLLPFFQARGGIIGAIGPSVQPGGGIALHLRFHRVLFLRLSTAFLSGPKHTSDSGAITGWSIRPAIDIGASWTVRRISIGPMATIAAPLSRAEFLLGEGSVETFTWFNVHGALGLAMGIRLQEAVHLTLDAGVGGSPVRKRFRQLSNRDFVLAAPFLDWSTRVGFLFYF